MQQAIVHTALVVRDYDEALAFYVGKLGFRLVEDTYQPEQDKRWVVVAPPGASATSLLLARATTPAQAACVGNQTGGRVFLFLQTDDFRRDYERLLAAGVRFVRPPSEQPYGTVAVFEDLYGTRWDLIQYRGSAPTDAIAAHVIGLEERALRRWCKGDPSGFLEISAADVVYFDPFLERRIDGLAQLTAHYEAIRGKVSVERFELLNPHVQVVGRAAVLTFNFVSYGGNEDAMRWNCTEVFRLDGEAWRLIQTHWSRTDAR